MIDARHFVGTSPCDYVQTDREGCPVRVGKASMGLHVRYRGGKGWAIEAAMHGQKNRVFIALVPVELCSAIEDTLIWAHRESLPYNNQGKLRRPAQALDSSMSVKFLLAGRRSR